MCCVVVGRTQLETCARVCSCVHKLALVSYLEFCTNVEKWYLSIMYPRCSLGVIVKSFSVLYIISVPNNIRSDPIMMWHSGPLWAIKVEMQSPSRHKHGLYNQTCCCTFHIMVSVHPCVHLHDYESTKLATAFDGTRMIRGPWSWSRIQRSFGKHRIFHWEVMIPKDQILWHQRLASISN